MYPFASKWDFECSQLRGVTQKPWISTMVSGLDGMRIPLSLGRFIPTTWGSSYPRSIGPQPSLDGVQPVSEHFEEGDRHARVLDQERAELDRLEHHRLDRLRRTDRCRSARPREQRRLAEEVARCEHVEGTSSLDLRLAREQHEEPASVRVLLDESVACRVRTSLPDASEPQQIGVGESLRRT